MNNELFHYGVKGMKWGVRRDKETLDRLAGRAYKIDYKDNGDYIIRKGSKLHRVSASPTNNRKGYAYTSFTDEDVKGYRKEISAWLDEINGVRTYDLTLKVTKDLVIPSEQEKVKSFIKLVGDDKISSKDLYVMRANNTSSDSLNGKPKKISDALQKNGLQKEVADAYALFSMEMFHNDKYKEIFFDDLKKKGYNAIDDLEDAISHRVNPLIVFERENTLKLIRADELPEPYSDDPKWDKIVKEAKEADAKTKQIHAKRGY